MGRSKHKKGLGRSWCRRQASTKNRGRLRDGIPLLSGWLKELSSAAKAQKRVVPECDDPPPKRAAPVERLAQRWLALRYEWNLKVLRGLAPVAERDRGAYKLLNPGALLLQLRPRFDALQINSWYRFGNSVRQLVHAFYMAELLGAKQLYMAQEHPFFKGYQAGGLQLNWGTTCSLPGPCLSGRFFHLDAFRLRRPPASDAARIFSSLVRPLISSEIGEPDPRVKDDDLILHIRSGDVFAGPDFPPRHGQPPASYYLLAVERERPTRVWLVYEDRANPCIAAIENALKSRGIEVLIQSGSLAGDLRVLLSGRRLVAGRGSFIYMIAQLSQRLRRLYIFRAGKHMRRHVQPLCELGVEVYVGKDADGEYSHSLLSRNWVCSPAQRAMMVSYPPDKIKIELVTKFSRTE